jgi:TetR/AcrR family tetracycline transcriptional repressor
MNHGDRRSRDLRRLEEAQSRSQERMAYEQERLNQRFDKMRERLTKKYGETSDSQQRIIEAALELLSEDGLNNLSLRKLATKVDMKAPALYWHFSSKDVLVDYMAEAILQREFNDLQPNSAKANWQDWLNEQMLKLRKAMLAYPDGARVVAGAHLQPAVTLGKLFETILAVLEESGMAIDKARHVLMTASNYT